jgi:hypothetical protein
MDLSTCEIPASLIPEEPVDRALELKAAFKIPFHFGPLEVPPLSIGTAALLEVGFVKVFKTQDITDLFGVAKLLFALVRREEAAELFFNWREWMESDEGVEFNADDPYTWHSLDLAVSNFAKENKVWDQDNYSPERLLKLFEYVYVAFNGFLMIPENQHSTAKWMFDLPSVAGQILMAGSTMNLSYFDALWRFPVSMASHLTSQNLRMNGTKFIDRPASKPFLDEYRQIIFDREKKGKFHPWQLREPVRYDVSPMQIHLYPDMGKKIAKLRDNFNAMSDKKKEKHFEKYSKIIEKEINQVKEKVGIADA